VQLAQATAPFDPFDAEMPSTDPMAPSPAYDPFDDHATGARPAGEVAQVDPNSLPAPSLEEAFQEPQVEQPSARDEPAGESEPSSAIDELEHARQAIDREMMRRQAEEGLDAELATPPTELEIEAAPPALEEEDAISEEIVAPADPLEEETANPDDSEGFKFPSDDDAELQYGGDFEPLPPLTPEQLELRRQQIEKERQEALVECDRLYDEVRSDSIKSISLDIRLEGTPGEDFPFECEGRRRPFQPRSWAPVTYQWKASGLCHKPLYFEQVQVERYGHSWGPVLQPIMSGVHFFGTVPILPYKMGLETPNECVYSLGYYRPGSCAPYMIEPLGFTWRAAAFQATAVTGAAFAIP
jgi:hypothetical protein